jgi:hypothetical protein
MVLVFAPTTYDENEDSNPVAEFFQNYSYAPVICVVTPEEQNEEFSNVFGSETILKQSSESNNKKIVEEGLEEAIKLYHQKLEEDVKPTFNMFDKDNSGNIDRAEFGEMMKQMGQELNQTQIDEAMKDLDLNGDGEIDLSEFNRWYFSGMQTYSGVRRNFKSVKSKGKKLLDCVGDEAKNILMKEELKYKHNKVSVTFNSPKKPQTELKVKINLGGSDNE